MFVSALYSVLLIRRQLKPRLSTVIIVMCYVYLLAKHLDALLSYSGASTPRSERTASWSLHSLPHLAHVAFRGLWPLPVGLRNPSGGPSTLSVIPETLSAIKSPLPIYESLPPDHSGSPRDVRDLIRDSEQLSITSYNNSL